MKHLNKFLSVFLICLIIFSAGSIKTLSEDNAIIISSVADFENFVKNCTLDSWSRDKKVILSTDLNLSGSKYNMVPSFSGEFDGNGHTISGIYYDETSSPCGLFRTIEQGGYVKNLNVTGIIEPGGKSVSAGGIAGENYGTIENCSFNGSIEAQKNAGGIAGYNGSSGTVQNCAAYGDIEGIKETGGIVGYNLGIIKNCLNNARINTTSTNPGLSPEDISLDFSLEKSGFTSANNSSTVSDTGGIAGYNSGVIALCTNNETVGYEHIGYNVGGIADRSSGFIMECTNNATVYGRKDIGGITGQAEPYIIQNITEDNLTKLKLQINELDALVTRANSRANSSTNKISNRLSDISDASKDAAEAIKNIDVDIEVSKKGSENNEHIEIGDNDYEVPEISTNIDFGNLTEALAEVSSQVKLLSEDTKNSGNNLSSDVKAIQNKCNEISNTMMDILNDMNDVFSVTDTSDKDSDSLTLGKIKNSDNNGYIYGDLNVGGIAGIMQLEYGNDPEDDNALDIDIDTKKNFEVKAIIEECTNNGEVTSRHNYVGGIAGRQELGMIRYCYSYGDVTSENGSYAGGISGITSSIIQSCYVKLTLSGSKYIGGIAGIGTENSTSESSSQIIGNYAMVNIESDSSFTGAIAGSKEGIYTENYFVSDELCGINGVSYSGKAEPLSFDELLDDENTPDKFKELKLSFVIDDEVIKTLSVEYGSSIDNSIYPEIPEKEGYYSCWDYDSLEDIHFDTLVTAIYEPYVSALYSNNTNTDGKNLVFVEGNFSDEDSISVSELRISDDEFDFVVKDIPSLLKNVFKSRIATEVLNSYTVQIPDDGLNTHRIRAYCENADKTDVYVLSNGKYIRVEDETVGSYVVFEFEGNNVQFTLIRTRNMKIFWIVMVIVIILLIVLIIRRPKLPKKPEKKINFNKKIIIIAAAVLVLAGGIGLFALRDIKTKVSVYELLSELNGLENKSMYIEANGRLDDEQYELSVNIAEQKYEGKSLKRTGEDNYLYYYDGSLILENGASFKISDDYPDYSKILDLTVDLFRNIDVKEENGIYTLKTRNADEILKLLIKDYELADLNEVEIKVYTAEDSVQKLSFSCDGYLKDNNKFNLNA
ncbi:MAG: GLUG motif-containing protein, partial [Erysipelotrichaceae bacterium]